MSLSQNIALLFIVLLGAFITITLEKKLKVFTKYLISFSGAFLFGLSVLHFLPEVYTEKTSNTPYYIILGFLLQLLLDYFSKGIEHGHIHGYEKKFPFGIYISLCVHSFIEGLPLQFHHEGHSHEIAYPLLSGILIHKLPISIVLATLLLKSGINKKTFWLSIIFFGLTAPLGSFAFDIFESDNLFSNQLFSNTMAIVMGMFLHVSTTIMFESNENHSFDIKKLLSIIIGLSLSVLLF